MIFLSHSIARSHTTKARARLLTLSTALVLISTSAHAQDTGKAAFDAYVAGLKNLGIEVENGAVDYDAGSDMLTISDSTLTFSGTIKDLPAEDIDVSDNEGETQVEPSKPKDLTYSVSFSAGTVSIAGMTHESGEFSAASWSYSDDTQFHFTGGVKGEGRLKVEGRMTGALGTNYRFTMPEIPAEDPEHPVSRWLPFMTTSLLMSFDEAKVDSTGATIEAFVTADGQETLFMSGTAQMDGYRMANAANGLVGEYSVDSIRQNMQTRDLSSGQMLNQSTRQGKTIYEDINVAALLNLLDPAVAETGEAVTLIGSGSAIDYESTQDVAEGLTFKVTAEKSTVSDITVTKRDNNVLALFDGLINKKAPGPEDLITNIFQLYRSFGVGDARVSGISLEVPAIVEEGHFGLTVKEVAMSGVNSNGIGEMLIAGLDAPKLPHGGSVKLDWAAVGDIEFADYEPMREMIGKLAADPTYGEQHGLEVARAFIPRSFTYEIEGLDVNVPDAGPVRIAKGEMSLSTTVPPIPTSIYLKNEGLEVPVKTIQDQEAKALLEALGLEKVVWSDETRLYWDEATLELRLERLMLNIEGLGMAEASARFANIPKALFEDPEGQGQMAAITAQFVEASLTYRDSGLTSKGIAHISQEQGIPENVFREALVSQAAEATAPIQNPAFTQMVSDAASKFLEDPKEFRVTLKPANPVPLAQILGSMAAPQTLPDLLNVKIEAN